MFKKALCITLSILMFAVPLLAQDAENACTQAKLDAQNNVNETLWFMAGCLGGVLGLGAAYLIEPNPKAMSLVGKSSEYVAQYSDCYTEEAKSIQTTKAKNGCLTYLGFYLVYVLLVVSAASSSA